MNTVGTVCGRCRSPLEIEDLRCPICSHAALGGARTGAESLEVEILRCKSCGAAVSYDVRVRAPSCAFCGSTMAVEAPEDPFEQTERFLPFLVDHPAAEASFRRWLDGLGWFRPSNLRTASTLESLRPLWWVGWVFDAESTVSWAADSDAGHGRADWAPHAGRTEFEFDDVVVSASRGLSQKETDFLAESYDLQTAESAPSGAAENATIERFDLPRSAARQRVAAMIERVAEERLKEGTIPGRRFRNIGTELVLRKLTTRRFAFPSHVLAYRYRGRLYRVVISGQDAGCLLGSAPYSLTKIVLTIVGSAFALAAVVATVVAIAM
jgi:hypothetical protein